MIRKLLFFFSLALCAQEELVIPLATKSVLTPIYLTTCDVSHSSFSIRYIEELCSILLFDLKHGGHFSISPKNSERDGWQFERGLWLETGVAYVVKPEVKEKSLSLKVFDVAHSKLKTYSDIPLSGNITDDRRKVHALTDIVHKNVCKVEGIATSRILYATQEKRSSGRWLSEIWEADYDGANAHPVTNEQSYCITPTFLPTVKGFAYVNYKLGQPKIYITSFKEQKGMPCVELRGNQLLPTFTRSGDKIAFISDASGRADLFVQSFDPRRGSEGKPIQAYTFPRSVQASPTFSPDGNQIAFVSDKDGTPRIYVIETPTGERNDSLPKARCLTTSHRDNTCPSWSPDGKKLAYSAKVEGVRQIMLYDCDTSREIQVTTGPGHKENPSWARNSMHIIYNSVTNQGSELFLLNIHQKEPVKITFGPGRKHYPVWEP